MIHIAEAIGQAGGFAEVVAQVQLGDAGLGIKRHGARIHHHVVPSIAKPGRRQRRIVQDRRRAGKLAAIGMEAPGRKRHPPIAESHRVQTVRRGGGGEGEAGRAAELRRVVGVARPVQVVERLGFAHGFAAVEGGADLEAIRGRQSQGCGIVAVVPAPKQLVGGAAAGRDFVGVGMLVVGMAIELGPSGGHPPVHQAFHQRPAQAGPQIDAAAVAVSEAGLPGRGLSRLLGDVVDDPGEGVAPELGVLRPLDNLHPLHVHQAGVDHGLALQIDAVHEHGGVLNPRRGEHLPQAADDRRGG